MREDGGIAIALSALSRYVDFTWVACAMCEVDRYAAEGANHGTLVASLDRQRFFLRLVVRRQRVHHPAETWRPWAEEEDAKLLEWYNRGDALADIAVELGRSLAGAACRIQTKGLSRPRPKRKAVPLWHMEENNLIGYEASCRALA